MAGEYQNMDGILPADDGNLILFEDFVRDRYLPFVQKNKRSWKTDLRYLERHILPYLGTCPLVDISEEKLSDWLATLELSGLSQSSRYRLFWLVKYILNCAVRWGLLPNDTAFHHAVFAREKRRRTPGILSPSEVVSLVHILDEYATRPSAQAIHLILLSGASKSEILNARWENVHLKRGVLAASMTYTGQTRLIPLNTEAVRLIRRIPRRKNVPWLFSSTAGRRLTSIFYTWNLIRNRLGRPELRIQDLRHSFAGLLMDMGIDRNNLKKNLGHYDFNSLLLVRTQHRENTLRRTPA